MTMKTNIAEMFDPGMDEADIRRFWSNVDIQRLNDCWEWTAGTNDYGYGMFFRHTRAHRISYYLKHGPYPNNLHVCHTCDNPPCVNPAHLFLGTDQDNVDDMRAKGRHAHGTVVNSAKMTKTQVLEIRRSYAGGSHSLDALCEQYGLTKAPMFQIVTGQTWKHVGGPIAAPGSMKGEENSQAVLTADNVREIRRIYDAGQVSQRVLANRFGVTQQTISDIVRRQSWTHMD